MALRSIDVLIVDDDSKLIQAMTDPLKKAGFRVFSANKVAQAISMLSNQKFDCAVVDLKLENSSGELVVGAMRKSDHHVNFTTPVILMSGFLNPDVLKSLGKQISGALTKPFEMDALIAKIKALIGEP